MKGLTTRRVIGMILGNLILGLGTAIFKHSLTGTDSFTALNLIISERIGWQFAVWQMTLNIIYLIIEFIFGRKYIGWGTLVNGLLLAYFVTFFYNIIQSNFNEPSSFGVQMVWMVIGLVVTGYGCALYQASDAGLAPFDFLPIGLSQATHLPFFTCRIFLDGLNALLAFLLGGVVGLGTLLCAFLLGPMISFFNRNINCKLMGVENKW